LNLSQDEEDKYLVADRITGKRASDDLKKIVSKQAVEFCTDVTQEKVIR